MQEQRCAQQLEYDILVAVEALTRGEVAADDADVMAELGRWGRTTLSDEAWDAEFRIERECEA